jgi:hypothetical protein
MSQGREHAEARRQPRFAITVPIYVAMVDGVIMRKQIALESRDVSAGGLCFETSRRLPLHADSRLVLSRLGDVEGGARIHGRVAYCVMNPATGKYRVGVEFTEFVGITSAEVWAHIERWVE